MAEINSVEALRALYREPGEKSLRKQLDRLDHHCRRFVALSPFLVIASTDADGRVDASPRGGDPGFVKVLDDRTVLIPDSPGNNRLDSLQNLIGRAGVGMLFMIPGVDETLRINGKATLRTDDALLALGCPKANVQVRDSNQEALGFYKSIGYLQDEAVSLGKRLIPDN